MLVNFIKAGKFLRKTRGFTLIELLIVIAIILILIAIALPNFLEAQERARVTRAKGNLRTMETAMVQHQLDFGCLPADFNDNNKNTVRCRARKSTNGPCTVFAGAPPPGNGGMIQWLADRRVFYAPNMHCPLTTPIKYMNSAETIDPFGDGTVPIGFDSREIGTNDANKKIIYVAFWAAGPDKIPGDWARGGPKTIDANRDGCPEGLPYNPTNGTQSRGELWGVLGEGWTWVINPGELPCGSAQREYVMQRTY